MLAESFRLHQRTVQIEAYEPSEVLVAWDWDTEDERRKVSSTTQRWIPAEQYELLVKRVIACEVSKSFEPFRQTGPKLLLRDAFLEQENDDNDANDHGHDDDSQKDEENEDEDAELE